MWEVADPTSQACAARIWMFVEVHTPAGDTPSTSTMRVPPVVEQTHVGELGPRGRSWTLPVGETTSNKEADWGIEDRGGSLDRFMPFSPSFARWRLSRHQHSNAHDLLWGCPHPTGGKPLSFHPRLAARPHLGVKIRDTQPIDSTTSHDTEGEDGRAAQCLPADDKNGGERARAPTHHPANRTPSGTIRRGRVKCGRQGSALPPPRGGRGHRQRGRQSEVPCSHSQKQTNRHTGTGVRGTRGKGGSADTGDMRQ